MKQQLNLPASNEIAQPSQELAEKLRHLALSATLFHEDLTDELVALWKYVFAEYSLQEIETGFNQWNRTGHWMPKPADICEKIDAYRASLPPPPMQKYPKHGRGYGEPDVMALWKLFDRKREQLGRPLKRADMDILLDELDEMTGRKK